MLHQTYQNLEVLVINDGSTDDTLTQIKTLVDKRIRVIDFEKNTKKIGAVNIVLGQVKGDLITFQDADDWSESDRIEEQVNEFLKSSKIGICFTNYRFVGKTTSTPKRIALTSSELKDEFLKFGRKENKDFDATNCPSMMITAEVLRKTRGYHPYFAGRVAEDIHWIYRILKEFEGVTINKVLYNYSIREGSFTQNQLGGKNAKYAYSWQLLSKIIYKDVYENIDVLAEKKEDLISLELEACEEALVEQIRLKNEIEKVYRDSTSYRIGKRVVGALTVLKGIKRSLIR
jgi:glycosyltransferase involved in cell wall biosynthesis